MEERSIIPMNDLSLDDATWSARSIAVPDLTPRFSFALSPTVYVGDPNSREQFQSGEHHRPLRLPDFGTRVPLQPTATEARGHEAALAAYYRQVMELKGRPPVPGEADYWLSVDIVSETAALSIPLPYWDQASDSAAFLDWLRTSTDGAAFCDLDQGWFLRATRRGERLHFLDGDLETATASSNSSVDRAAFLRRLDAAEADVRAVIAGLKAELGVDPWS